MLFENEKRAFEMGQCMKYTLASQGGPETK